MSYTFGGTKPVNNKPSDNASAAEKAAYTNNTATEKPTGTPKPLEPNDKVTTLGGSITQGSVDKDWTSDQSSLIAKNGGTINVGSTTTVTGAVVASENVDKPLIINTTELITNNLQDNDESTNTTIGFNGITINHTDRKQTSLVPTTDISYSNTDKEQNTLATMSNVVVNTKSGQVDLVAEGINTDISKAQEVTKDEETNIDITVHTELLDPKKMNELKNSWNSLQDNTENLVEWVEAAVSNLISASESNKAGKQTPAESKNMMATVMIGNILHDDLDFSKEEIENFFKKDEEGKYNLDDLKDHLNKLGVANISKVEVISEDTKITIVNKDGSTTEVTGKDVNGAYGPNGEIYLSETFLNNATSSAAIAGVINEEFGESMAYQNGYDTAGGTETYGQIFSNNASRDSKDEPIDLDGKATVTGGAIVVNGVDINDSAIRVVNLTSGIMDANKEESNSTNFHNAQDTQEILEDLKRKGIKIIGNKIYFSSEDMLYEYDAKLKDISSDTRKKYVLLYEPITPSGLKMAEEKQEAKKKEENIRNSNLLARQILKNRYAQIQNPNQTEEEYIKNNLLSESSIIQKMGIDFGGNQVLKLDGGNQVRIGNDTDDFMKVSNLLAKNGINIMLPENVNMSIDSRNTQDHDWIIDVRASDNISDNHEYAAEVALIGDVMTSYKSIMATPFNLGNTSKIIEGEIGWNMSITGSTINGRYYTAHALERMAPSTPEVLAKLQVRAEAQAIKKGYVRGSDKFIEEVKDYIQPRNIPPSVVEDAIQNTKPQLQPNGNYEFNNGRVRVILNDEGSVITVMPQSSK